MRLRMVEPRADRPHAIALTRVVAQKTSGRRSTIDTAGRASLGPPFAHSLPLTFSVAMRICIFTDSFLPYISGVTSAVCNQANELVRRGHGVSIFHPALHKRDQGHAAAGLDPSISLHALPLSIPMRNVPKLRVTVPLFLGTYRRLNKSPPDLIHCHTEWGCGLEGSLLGRRMKVPVIGTFHTFFAEPEYMKQLNLPSWSIVQKATWKYSVSFFNRCQRVICPSESVRTHLLDKGLSREAIVLSNGIEKVSIRPRHEIVELRRSLGIDDFAFVYVGRISPEKSMEIALEAFAKTHQANPKARFVIVGSGPSDDDVDSKVRSLGLQDAVVRTGRIERDVLMDRNYPLLGDAFVTASKTENQPISILEAMAFGLPLIGPKAKGIPELISHEDNGFIFAPDSVDEMAAHMSTLMADRDRCRAMGQRSLEIAENHQMDRIGERLEAIYQQAIAEVR